MLNYFVFLITNGRRFILYILFLKIGDDADIRKEDKNISNKKIIKELHKLCSSANKSILSLLDNNEINLSGISDKDILCISEIKKSKDGISIKFIDRIDGYIKLYNLISETAENSDPFNFIDAISKSTLDYNEKNNNLKKE